MLKTDLNLDKAFVRITLLLLMVSGVGKVAAQPSWEVDETSFEHSMSIIGSAWLDHAELNSEGALVGAFFDNVCVGVAAPGLHEPTGRYLFYMVVFGNSEHIGQNIRFELYQGGSDAVSVQNDLVQFEVDGIFGGVEQPFLVSEPQLGIETDILSFSLGPNTINVDITEDEVNVIMSQEAFLGSLIPEFELSEGARLLLEDEELISGGSFINYTNPLILSVHSEGGFYSKDYTLTVTRVADFVMANNFMSPNGDGINDVWLIDDAEKFSEYRIEVRSEVGKTVFSQIGYDTPWDGHLNGNPVPAGTYRYFMKDPTSGYEFRGFINLVY